MSIYPTVTVIIPFYGKSESQIINCLKALSNQTYFKDKIEIVVIDNNLVPVLKEQLKENYDITILHEYKYGSYSARNKGIEIAKGDVLAFTDSDCIPHIDWIKNSVSALQLQNLNVAIGGNIVFTFKDYKQISIYEFYDCTLHLRQEHYVKNYGYAATANLIVPKHIIIKVGIFNTKYYSGGDKEWGERATKSGFKLVFDKDVIVFHPARATAFSIIKKNIRTIGGEFVRIQTKGLNRISIFAYEKVAIKSRRDFIANGMSMFNKITRVKIILFFYTVQAFRLLEALRLFLGGAPQRQ